MTGEVQPRHPAPPSFAGLELSRPRVMGVINVTPDSFSDGGERLAADDAVAAGLAMLEQGADILDVGGESTRPGALPVDAPGQIRRIAPVIRRLAREGALISVDARDAEVMRAALDEGAAIVNDITALTGDARALPLVAASGASVVLMHMQGEPRSMQDAPHYDDAPAEVCAWLRQRVAACENAGIGRSRIAVDPGIGFGKTVEHNLQILARLHLYRDCGCALLVGLSRKSFIARLSRGEPPRQRGPGSIAAALAAVHAGAHILRVHDVAEMQQALAVWQAIVTADERE